MRGHTTKLAVIICFITASLFTKAQDTLHLNFHHTQVTVHDSLQKKVEAWAKSLNGKHVNINVYGYYHRPEFRKFAQQRCDEMFLVLNRKARSLITIESIGPKKGEDYQRTRVDIVYYDPSAINAAQKAKLESEAAAKAEEAKMKAEEKAKDAAEKAEKEKMAAQDKEKKKAEELAKKAEAEKNKTSGKEQKEEKNSDKKEVSETNKGDKSEKASDTATDNKQEEVKAASSDESYLTEEERKKKEALEKKAKKKNK